MSFIRLSFVVALVGALVGCAAPAPPKGPPDFSTPDTVDFAQPSADLAGGRDLSTSGRNDLASPVDLATPPDFTMGATCDGPTCAAACIAACILQQKGGVGFCSNNQCFCTCV